MTGREYFKDPLLVLRDEFPHVGILRLAPNRWVACFGRAMTVSAGDPDELREKLCEAAVVDPVVAAPVPAQPHHQGRAAEGRSDHRRSIGRVLGAHRRT
jgi:hypothetical protein